MRKPRLKIEVGIADGVFHYQIFHKGDSIAWMGNYSTDAEACEAAELKKVELQEEMMKTYSAGSDASPPVATFKVKNPRKVKAAKATNEECRYSQVCDSLTEAICEIQSITIGQAGDNVERLRKAADTIENVRKDLSEIK